MSESVIKSVLRSRSRYLVGRSRRHFFKATPAGTSREAKNKIPEDKYDPNFIYSRYWTFSEFKMRNLSVWSRSRSRLEPPFLAWSRNRSLPNFAGVGANQKVSATKTLHETSVFLTSFDCLTLSSVLSNSWRDLRCRKCALASSLKVESLVLIKYNYRTNNEPW